MGQDEDDSGQFFLRAANSSGYIDIKGFPDGTLTWGGSNLVRTVNGVSADAAGAVSIFTSDGKLEFPNGTQFWVA